MEYQINLKYVNLKKEIFLSLGILTRKESMFIKTDFMKTNSFIRYQKNREKTFDRTKYVLI